MENILGLLSYILSNIYICADEKINII
jgi:hypothetical protein